MCKIRFPTRATVAIALAICAAGHVGAATLTEGFESVTPAGWTVVNASDSPGSDWFQGEDNVFDAQAGPRNSFAGANFDSTTGAGTIDNWLITPTLSFNNGDTVSFFTRTTTDSPLPDRLEVRFSNVGGSNTANFSTLLLSINPNLAASGYPETWTQYSATITGLSGPSNGAIAFRYFVTDGGPLGDNSNYLGLDTVSITAAVPEPASYLLMGLGLAAVGLRRRHGRK